MSDAPLRPDEQLQFWAARLSANLPGEVQVLLSGKPPVRVDGQTLDPHIQMILASRDRLGKPPLHTLDVAAARARMRRDALAHAGPPIAVGAVSDLEIQGAEGPLRARHYAPKSTGTPRPLLVFFHGGGFVVCDLDTHDAACRLLCREADVHVLSVDYRLAPEHPFPAAVEDARAALRWAFAHAGELGADARRVAVGGDSAGGNLAAVTSQLASRDGGPAPVCQLLIYPSADRSTPRPSREQFAEGFFLTESERRWYDGHYRPDTPTETDPRVSPLLASELGGLPPAIVATAAFDPLRDEGEAYARAMEAAGVSVTLTRAPGLIHGFINMIGFSKASRRALTEIAHQLKSALD
jgi:acetyl esterase